MDGVFGRDNPGIFFGEAELTVVLVHDFSRQEQDAQRDVATAEWCDVVKAM
jgi:hypothetical protein